MNLPLQSLIAFAIITLVLGGAAAFMTGRALANAWRPQIVVLVTALPLAAAVRFLHATLAEEPIDAVKAAIAFALMTAFAYAGFVLRRRQQMARQYPWLAGDSQISKV